VYSREIDGREFTFGVSGKLIRNVLVMYDRQTGSLWSQLLGESVQGELQGTRLEFLPSWMTTWEDWKEQHPETLALRKGFGGSRDPYSSYYTSSQTGVIGELNRDDRLYVKEFVIGVEVDGKAAAFPFSALNSEPVLDFDLAEMPLVIVFSSSTGTGVVFDRRVDGQLLTFSQLEGTQIMDAETGTTWDGLSGTALSGPLLGSQLERVKSTAVFWFGWKDWFPETTIYGIDTP
jgi:hypothetical protein